MSLVSSDPLFISAAAYAMGRNVTLMLPVDVNMFATGYINHLQEEPPDRWLDIKEYFHSYALLSLAADTEE